MTSIFSMRLLHLLSMICCLVTTNIAFATIDLNKPPAAAFNIPEFLDVDDAYQLTASYEGETPAATDPTHLILHWQIAPEYYLYGHNLKILVNGNPIQPNMPPGDRHYDELLEREVLIYRQQLQLALPVSQVSTSLTVTYQGCADAGLCYPPQTRSFQLDEKQQRVSPDSLGTSTRPQINTPKPTNAPGGLIGAILLALAGGLILNLMPCVFPILSLKALGFANSVHAPHQQHLHGWSYTLGAIATFTLIAAVLFGLRAAGQSIGWGFQLQSPVFVSFLIYLFFLMGLSLAGALHLSLRWTDLGDDLTHGHSLKASFFTGALASIVASPCTAPFMGAAMGYAITQPAAIGLTVFASLGLGMALPFLLLSYLPQLASRLPKPGPWMETLKQFMAFPLFLTAAWLLWVLGHQSGADAVAKLVCGAIALAFAGWLLHPSSSAKALGLRRLLAVGAIALAIWLIPTKEPAQSDHWQPYTPARLTELQQSGQAVFINLTADWCITCLANEKIALDTQQSQAAFTRNGIVRLKGDWTNHDPEITALLSQYGRNGVPLYLFFPAGETQAIILPQLLTQSSLLNIINQKSTE